MADSAAPPAPQSPKKAVKKRAPAKPAAHPPFKDMIKAAIANLKERNGSSRQKITKYILSNYKGLGDEAAAKRHIKMALETGVSSGALLHTKGVGASGSFKLSKVAKAAPKKKAATKKKPAAKKAAKKPTAKKPKAKKAKKPAAKKAKDTKAKKPKSAKKPKAGKKPAAKKPKAAKKPVSKPKPKKSPKKGAKKPSKAGKKK